MPIVPVADYAPDRAPLGGAHLTVARGVYPRSDGTDGPLRGPAVRSNALAAAVMGAFSARAGDKTGWVIGATAAGLYTLNGLAWADRSGAVYTTAAGDYWRFTQFGERIIAVNGANAAQVWVLGAGGTFANLAAGAPVARHVATFEPGFVMMGGIASPTAYANGVWWSGLNDATSWPTIGTAAAASVQSDLQQLPNGGYVTGLVPAVGGASGLVLTERAIYRVEYIGPPQVFAFREVDRGRGNVCPDGMVQVGGVAYFVSEDGFIAFDGTEARPIGWGKVDRTFFASLDPSGLDRVRATVDLARQCVIWSYPTTGGPNDRWLIYNWTAGRWRECDDPAIVGSFLFPARTASTTLDGLDALYAGGIDAIPISLDSALFVDGRPVLAAFDTLNRLVVFEGATLAARVETSDFEGGGKRFYVSGVRPLTDAAAPSGSVGYRDTLSAAVTYTTPNEQVADSYAPQRVTGRYPRGRVDIAAGATWTYLQGADLRLKPAGVR